jgi:hypothetical protein
MIDRRRASLFALLALPAVCFASRAHAQQSFQRFVPFLVDLPGWTGKKADGMAMEMAGTSMITATRAYERGDAKLNAQIITGPAAQGALAATKSGIKLETSDMHMSTATIDGLSVTRTYVVSSKSGTILVGLSGSAMFNLTFTGITEDEALGLVKKFDWKAMQGQVK